MKNWKTTISGGIIFAGGIYLIVKGETVQGALCLATGLGLLSAKDNNVTGGSVEQ